MNIDRLRARQDSPLAELYLYGKLLYAAVIEKLLAKRFGHGSSGMDGPRTHTPWRLWQLVTKAVCANLVACFPVRSVYLKDALRSLCERSRKRQLQTLPPPVFELLAFCRKIGVSAV